MGMIHLVVAPDPSDRACGVKSLQGGMVPKNPKIKFEDDRNDLFLRNNLWSKNKFGTI